MIRGNKKAKGAGPIELGSPLTGQLIGLEEVGDEVFSQRILGDGVAVRPVVGQLYAPAAGRIEQVFETAHALTLVTEQGAELLLHVGIDTVQLKGRFFTVHVKAGDRVALGDLLVTFDREGIAGAGFDTTTPMIVSNLSDYTVEVLASGAVNKGQPVLRLCRR